MFYEEIRIKQDLSYISICSLSILYNSKFILMATSLGTNAVIVTRVHCIIPSTLHALVFMSTLFKSYIETIMKGDNERLCTTKSLRKHAYSNTLKILPPKNDNFSDKKFWYFSYFCSKHRLWYSLEPPHRGGSNEYPQWWGGSNEYPQSVFEQK